MAIEAKASFLKQTEKQLATTITADMMAKVLSIVSDVMEEHLFRLTNICKQRS